MNIDMKSIILDRIQKISDFSRRKIFFEIITLSVTEVEIRTDEKFASILKEISPIRLRNVLISNTNTTKGLENILFITKDATLDFIEVLNSILVSIPLHTRQLRSLELELLPLMKECLGENIKAKFKYMKGIYRLSISSNGTLLVLSRTDPDELREYVTSETEGIASIFIR